MTYTEKPRRPAPPWDVQRVTSKDRAVGLLWGTLFRDKRAVSALPLDLLAHLSGVPERDLREMESGRVRFSARHLLNAWESWMGSNARCIGLDGEGCPEPQAVRDRCHPHHKKHERRQHMLTRHSA